MASKLRLLFLVLVVGLCSYILLRVTEQADAKETVSTFSTLALDTSLEHVVQSVSPHSTVKVKSSGKLEAETDHKQNKEVHQALSIDDVDLKRVGDEPSKRNTTVKKTSAAIQGGNNTHTRKKGKRRKKKREHNLQKSIPPNPAIESLPVWEPSATAETKPHLIIHIGPSKTGTSTIQKESVQHFTEPLQADNYVYLGKFADRRNANIPGLFHADACFKRARRNWRLNGTAFLDNDCWKDRVAGIEAYRQKNISIVLSDETYSYAGMYHDLRPPDYNKMLRVAFQDWNVLVVPTYRRYFEWVLSTAKEVNRNHCHKETRNWEDGPCINLWDKVKESLNNDGYRARQYTNLDVTIPAWQGAGFQVQVLNFHRKRHITCSLYCDVVPNTPHSCQFCLQEMERQDDHQNHQDVSMTAYNDIVYEAATRGFINDALKEKWSRQETTNDLANRMTASGKGLTDLPLFCPSETDLESLVDKSLELEKKLAPFLSGYNDTLNKEEHRKAFQLLAEEGKAFCSVNVDALFSGLTSWEQVLDVLNTTAMWPITILA